MNKVCSNIYKYSKTETRSIIVFDYTKIDLDKTLSSLQDEIFIITNIYDGKDRKNIYELCENKKMICKGFLDKKLDYDRAVIYQCIADNAGYSDDESDLCGYIGPSWKWESWDISHMCRQPCNHRYCSGIKCPECGRTYDSGDIEPKYFIDRNNCIAISKSYITVPSGYKCCSSKKNKKTPLR